MNQDPEVVTGHTMIAAYLIFTPLLKEKGLQQAAILFREFVQNLPHLLLHLPPGDGLKDADRRIKNGIDDFLIGRKLSAAQSIMLL